MNRSSSFELTVSTFFDAAHRLLDEHYGTGTRLHGHTYNVVVSIRGTTLRGDGMVFDHYDVRGSVQRVRERLHDTYLNDVAALADVNTTPEVIAEYLWNELTSEITAEGIESMAVEVAESPTMRVRYEAPLDGAGAPTPTPEPAPNP
ncbi:MAG: 6-pyruvoyl trahydropterin synthase family protein [Acidimicrobiales bacterium]